MKRRATVHLALVVLSGWSLLPLNASVFKIPNEITNNTTWVGARFVDGVVNIHPGVVVMIQAGTSISMSSTNASIIVRGQLLANGTADQPIQFVQKFTNTPSILQFLQASDSRLQGCRFEYANTRGSLFDYFGDNCLTSNPPRLRQYREAVAVVGSRLLIENTTFQNPSSQSAKLFGGAVAVISDDPIISKRGSAEIRNCRFLTGGQGIHGRHSFLLIEDCSFTRQNAANSSVDLYGESSPPPIVRNCRFDSNEGVALTATACSALVERNIFQNGNSKAIVLRGKCGPIVRNNLIHNFPDAAISLHNQCAAMLANNTLVHCAVGVLLSEDPASTGSPLCLPYGSASATLLNCLIWDCPASLVLSTGPRSGANSASAAVLSCNIEGGRENVWLSTNAFLTWRGNIAADPGFAVGYRLGPGSPCIDTGSDPAILTTRKIEVTTDADNLPRPLDGNGDGIPAFDIGFSEFLLPGADSNKDGIPDGWAQLHGFNPLDSTVGSGNPDNDAFTTLQEWLADTDPTDPLSYFSIQAISIPAPGAAISVQFKTSPNRFYTLLRSPTVGPISLWSKVPTMTGIQGDGRVFNFLDTNTVPGQFYLLNVRPSN